MNGELFAVVLACGGFAAAFSLVASVLWDWLRERDNARALRAGRWWEVRR